MGDVMQRYFIKSDQLVEGQAVMIGDDAHHIATVMRGTVGDHLVLCVQGVGSYLAEIFKISQAEVHVRVVQTKVEHVELPVCVTIAQGMIKGDKFDWVLQKATECGASGFIPVAMKRSVAKLDEVKASKKIKRWQKIVLEAARQSHRQVVPTVEGPVDLKALVARAAEYDVCLFAYEAHLAAHQHTLAHVIAEFESGQRVLVLIGPEGGFDAFEVGLLMQAAFKAVGLGPRILRTGTAPIYVMSAISYTLEVVSVTKGEI